MRHGVAALILVALSAGAARAGAPPPPKRIVALYWYSKDFPSNVDFDRGLQAALQKAAPGSVEYHAEFLESNRFVGDAQSLALRDYLAKKYGDRGVDVLVALSQVSLDFLVKYRDTLFPATPIVFHTFSRPAVLDQRAGANMTGIVADNVFANTLRAALDLHPDTRQVLVVVQTTERNREFEAAVRAELAPFERRAELVYLTDLTLDAMLSRVKSVGEHSLVLFVRYSQDTPGSVLDPSDVLALVANATTVPVYALAGQTTLGRGNVGGYGFELEPVGARAGEMALQILKGTPAPDIPLFTVATSAKFDWRQLERWSIDERRLPPGSQVRFRPETFWQRYGRYAAVALGIIAGQALLIVGLLLQRSRRRRAEQELRGTEAELRHSVAHSSAIIRALPDVMFVLSRDGVYLDYHAKDPADRYVPASQFIGKNVSEVMPPDVASRFTDAFRRVSESDEPVVVEYSLRAGGEERQYETRLVSYEHDRILGVVRDITERHRSEAALVESERVLRAADERNHDLAGRLIASQEAERQRIARDLHDDLSQMLALLNIDVDQLAKEKALARAGLSDRVREISRRTGDIATEVHRLSHELHPSKLQALGLVTAVQAECRDVSRQHGIRMDFSHDGVPPALSPDVSLCLYRIAQEALHNVVKHSGATNARVRLSTDGATLCLLVEDEGAGFDQGGEPREGLGLVSMQERANFVGGKLVIESRRGRGTRITVRVPLSLATPLTVSA